jgi:hypothetical protein
LRDIIENYKFQIQEKDKEIITLKVKIANLRKNNDELLSQRNLKKSGNIDKSNRQSTEFEDGKRRSNVDSRAKNFKADPNPRIESRSMGNPVKFEHGVSLNTSIKWSDEAFNSKIKEI